MEELLRIFNLSKASWTSTDCSKYMQFLEGGRTPGSAGVLAGKRLVIRFLESKYRKVKKSFPQEKKKAKKVNLHTWFLYWDALVRSHETNSSLRKQKACRAGLLTGSVSCGSWTLDLQGSTIIYTVKKSTGLYHGLPREHRAGRSKGTGPINRQD